MRTRTGYTKKRKQEIVNDYLNWSSNTGGAVRGYAIKHNIPKTTLYAWVKENNKKSKNNTLALVKLTPDPKSNNNIINTEDTSIKITTSFCSIELPTLIEKENMIKIFSAIKAVR